MKKPNDLIFYGSALYEIETETDKQYSLKEYLNFAESRLVCGWVDKNALGIGDRVPGDDYHQVQLAMVNVHEEARRNKEDFDPIS